MLGDAGRAGLLPQQAASAREGLCSLQVMDAAWTTYPRVPCVLRKTACLLHREFSGTRLFLCTDPNIRKAALVLAILWDLAWRVDLECALHLCRMPAGPFIFSVASVFRGLLESMEALTSRDCLGFTVL